MDWTQLPEGLLTNSIQFATKVLLALIILYIGWKIINFISRKIAQFLDNQKLDATLRPALKFTVSLLLKILLLLSVAGTVGIKTTSFIAVLGAFSFALGLALQGSLGHLAGGILLLTFRPIKVGDYIKAQGEEGIVKEVQLFVTILETADRETIFLPNGTLVNGNITNYTRAGQLRLHIPVGIGYGENIGQARKVLLDVMQADSLVLVNPRPQVAVVNLGDNSVDLQLRPWCKPEHKPAVFVNVLEKAKIALDEAGIDIPYPQRVIHTQVS